MNRWDALKIVIALAILIGIAGALSQFMAPLLAASIVAVIPLGYGVWINWSGGW
jgi:hypothetical protein